MHNRRRPLATVTLALTLAATLASGCGGVPDVVVNPPVGSTFGHVRVHLQLADVDLAWLAQHDGLQVWVGEKPAIDLAPDMDGLGMWLTVQGAAQAGPADIRVRWPGGEKLIPGAFTFRLPGHPDLELVTRRLPETLQ